MKSVSLLTLVAMLLVCSIQAQEQLSQFLLKKKKEEGPFCPKLICDISINNDTTYVDEEQNNNCYWHSGDDPVTEINLKACRSKEEKCLIDHKNFAWVSTTLQFAEKDSRSKQSESQVFGKQIM